MPFGLENLFRRQPPGRVVDAARAEEAAEQSRPNIINIPPATPDFAVEIPGDIVQYLIPQGSPASPGVPSPTPTVCFIYLNDRSTRPFQLRPGEFALVSYTRLYITTLSGGDGVDLLVGDNMMMRESNVEQAAANLLTQIVPGNQNVTQSPIGLHFFGTINNPVQAGDEITSSVVQTIACATDRYNEGTINTPPITQVSPVMDRPVLSHFLLTMEADDNLNVTLQQNWAAQVSNWSRVGAIYTYLTAAGVSVLCGPVAYPFMRIRCTQPGAGAFNLSACGILLPFFPDATQTQLT